jgi:hypothetical protein
MTFASLRQSERHVIAYCLNDACLHTARIDVSSYPVVIPAPRRVTRIDSERNR